MKKRVNVVGIMLLLASLFFVTSCGGGKTEGKWLDYGNGLINLSKVGKINTTFTGFCDPTVSGFGDLPCITAIKFDNFTLTIESRTPKSKSDLEKLKKTLNNNLRIVTKFLESDFTYAKLN